MDADTKAELDALADATILSDGVCRVTDVILPQMGGNVAEVRTDLGEKFPMFDLELADVLACGIGRRVKLTIQTSGRGTRYVSNFRPMPYSQNTFTFPCASCGALSIRSQFAKPVANGLEIVPCYRCPLCHYQMEVGV